MAPDANAPCPVPAIAPISANLASSERIGTPGRACVSAPLPLRGRPPLQGGHYILPLAKGESRRRRQGVAHTRQDVLSSLRPFCVECFYVYRYYAQRLPAGRDCDFSSRVR